MISGRGRRQDQTDRDMEQSGCALLFGVGKGEFAVTDAHG
jgi:hypothetical protein